MIYPLPGSVFAEFGRDFILQWSENMFFSIVAKYSKIIYNFAVADRLAEAPVWG